MRKRYYLSTGAAKLLEYELLAAILSFAPAQEETVSGVEGDGEGGGAKKQRKG